MAASSAKIEYFRAATAGSAAYDLYRVPGYEECAEPKRRCGEEKTERARENVKEHQKTKAKTAAKTAVREREARVSVFSVAGFAVVAVLVICILLSYVQLAEISTTMTTLQGRMSQLEMEDKRLTVEYEKAFNLAAIEAYATEELNMTRLTDDKIIAVDIDRVDSAEILTKPEVGANTVTGAVNYISSLMAYFK